MNTHLVSNWYDTRVARAQVFAPRSSAHARARGAGPAGARGARLLWALNGTHLVVSGFDK